MNKDSYHSIDKDISAEKSQIVNEIFTAWESLVSEIISYHSKSLKYERLKLPSFFIMNYLYRNGPQNLSVLANLAGVSKPTITSIVDNLENHGLVARTKDTVDRRKLAVDITPLAGEKMKRIFFSKDDVKTELAKALSSDQLNAFRESICVLGTIVRSVSEKKLTTMTEGEENY